MREKQDIFFDARKEAHHVFDARKETQDQCENRNTSKRYTRSSANPVHGSGLEVQNHQAISKGRLGIIPRVKRGWGVPVNLFAFHTLSLSLSLSFSLSLSLTLSLLRSFSLSCSLSLSLCTYLPPSLFPSLSMRLSLSGRTRPRARGGIGISRLHPSVNNRFLGGGILLPGPRKQWTRRGGSRCGNRNALLNANPVPGSGFHGDLI